MVTGAFTGMLIQQAYQTWLISGELVNDTWIRFITRYMIALGISLPWFYLGEIFGKQELGPYGDLFVLKFIPCLLLGLFGFWVADTVNSKLGQFEMQQTVKKEE